MYRRKTFSIVFFCKKTKINRKGKAPVYARITTSGVSTEIYTRCKIEPQHWCQCLERSTLRDPVSLQINEIISSLRANILAAYDSIIKEGKEPTCFAVKDRLENPATANRMFLYEFERYCEKRQSEVGIRITQLTANKYRRLLRYMKEYTEQQYKKDDLPLDIIDYAYIDGLNTFMQTAYNCKNNGAVNLLCCLKNFILYAIRNEWIEKSPFRYYKLRIDKTNVKIPLTKSELDTLIHKPIWIHKPREKTSVMSRIPLLPYPISVLRKYERDIETAVRNKLLPVPSNQKMNAYLKEIATICNIDKNLTTHCARHTFATLAIEYGMPIDIIAKILGHTNTNMTRRYAKISEANIGR